MNHTKTAVALLLAVSANVFSSGAFAASDPSTDGGAVLSHHDQVKQARAKNRAFAKTVQVALRQRKDLDSSGIFAFARGPDVILVGEAQSQDQINLAGNVAQSVAGVKSVKNNVTVDEVGN